VHPDSPVARAVLAGLLAAGADVIAVSPRSAGLGFAYASRDRNLRDTRQAVERLAAEIEGNPVPVAGHGQLVEMVGDTPPIRTTDLTLPIARSWARLRSLYLGARP